MRCCIPGCSSVTGDGLTFGTLSKSKKKKREEWLKAIGMPDWNPLKAVICEFHFTDDDFKVLKEGGKKKLKASAVPRLALNNDKENELIYLNKNQNVGDHSYIKTSTDASRVFHQPPLKVKNKTTNDHIYATSIMSNRKPLKIRNETNLAVNNDKENELNTSNKDQNIGDHAFIENSTGASKIINQPPLKVRNSITNDHTYATKTMQHHLPLKVSHETKKTGDVSCQSKIGNQPATILIASADHNYSGKIFNSKPTRTVIGKEGNVSSHIDVEACNETLREPSLVTVGLQESNNMQENKEEADKDFIHSSQENNLTENDQRMTQKNASSQIDVELHNKSPRDFLFVTDGLKEAMNSIQDGKEDANKFSEYSSVEQNKDDYDPSAMLLANPQGNVSSQPDVKHYNKLLKEVSLLKAQLNKVINNQWKEKEKLNEVLRKKAEKAVKENILLRRKLLFEKKAKERLEKRLKLVELNVKTILSPSQIKAIGQKSSRGVKWGNEDIKCALSLKSRCGSRGYSDVAKRFVYPAVRTLNKRTEHIKFESGILNEVFDKLNGEVPLMNEKERHAMMALDEMAISANDKIVDPSTKKPIGACTLPGHTGPANKALVFAVAGLSTRWKQSLAYYFTKAKDKNLPKNVNSTGEALKTVCETLIMKSEAVKLQIHVVTSDMGSDNRGMWAAFGVKANRNTIVSSIPNPARPDDFICFMADVPHVFKRLKLMFTEHQFIILPDDIVNEFQLPSNVVKLDHLKALVDYESNCELKVAYRLDGKELGQVGQYEKMKMAGARKVLCHRTYVGLELLAELDNDMKTTAWFIKVVNKWFDLMTSRSPSLALCLRNAELYAERIAHLKLTIRVFQNMKVGSKGYWKPVQTGVLISTNSVLLLQEKLLHRLYYSFILTARFTQDFIENLFSMVRSKSPVPTALQFKYILRDITLSRKCSIATKGSSYDLDEGSMLLDMLLYTKQKKESPENIELKNENAFDFSVCINDSDIFVLSDWELSVIYDMAGSALSICVKVHKVRHSDCVSPFLWKEATPHPFSAVVKTKNYVENAQYEVSNETFLVVAKSEIIFRILRDRLFETSSVNVLNTLIEKSKLLWDVVEEPPGLNKKNKCCSNMKKWYFETYFKMRLKQYQIQKGKTSTENAILSSRSLGMREKTKNLIIRKNKKAE